MSYDIEKGFTNPADADPEKMCYIIKVCAALINNYYKSNPSNRILAAGAGGGLETYLLFNEFNVLTVGIDKNIDLKSTNSYRKACRVNIQDISSLAFPGHTFSLVYCYHVLEHVNNPSRVLQEFYRVLIPGGVLFIGFPNKHRLLAYIGTNSKTTLPEKIFWNINDYIKRLTGRFENKYGAHAGFTEKEFYAMAAERFTNIVPLRNQYIFTKYHQLKRAQQFIEYTNLSEVLFPSNYFICIKDQLA
jgi:2-polyprenyl-3-methyl-5-hydroxy-6-metoxy-1,4-benzoquinol methylase